MKYKKKKLGIQKLEQRLLLDAAAVAAIADALANEVIIFDAETSAVDTNSDNIIESMTDEVGGDNSATIAGDPTLSTINGVAAIAFDGSGDELRIARDDANINYGSGERAFTIVFETGTDINSTQVLFEQGGSTYGMNANIYAGKLGFGVVGPDDYVEVDIEASTAYVASFIYDRTDSGTMSIYLNGVLQGYSNTTIAWNGGSNETGIGGVNGGTDILSSGSGNDGNFSGKIGAFVYSATAYTSTERVSVETTLANLYSITAVSDLPPIASDSTVTATEDTSFAFSTSDFNYSDPDGSPMNAVRINTTASNGTLYLDANNNDTFDTGESITNGQVVTVADINAGHLQFIGAPNANGAGYASFSFFVNDGTNFADIPSTMTIDVTPVYDFGETPVSIANPVLHFDAQNADSAVGNPEYGLTPDIELDVGALGGSATIGNGGSFDINENILNRNTTALIAIDVSFPSSSPQGALFEYGGTGRGTYIGFDGSGNFIASTGSGGNSFAPNDTARITLDPTGVLLGRTGTLYTRIDMDAESITVWFKEGGASSSNALELIGADTTDDGSSLGGGNHQWSGGDDGGVGQTQGSVAGSIVNSSNDDFNGSITQFRYYDAQNIGVWQDLAADPTDGALNHTAVIGTGPVLNANAFGTGRTGVDFSGTSSTLEITQSNDMGMDTNGYNEKSFAVVFRTGDINGDQLIFEQGGGTNAYALGIFDHDTGPGVDYHLYAYAYKNLADGSTADDATALIDLGAVSAHTSYSVIVNHDGDNGAGIFSASLDGGAYINAATSLDTMPQHTDLGGIGGTNNSIVSPFDLVDGGATISNVGFEGAIGELYSWNTSLTSAETTIVSNYLQTKWFPSGNNAPTASNNTLSISEDISAALSASHFNYADADSDPLNAVRIDTTVANGTLYLDTNNNDTFDSGEAVTNGQIIGVSDINAGNLQFISEQGAFGNNYANFTFSVYDGSDYASTSSTMTINVDGVNDAPTDITLSRADVDENSASGTSVGTLGAVDADVGDSFTYTLLDDAGGLFALNGDVLEVAGALNHEAAGSHDIVVEVDDGQATYQRTLTISVNDVNEAPSGADVTVTTAEDTPRTFLVSDFGFSDVDDGDSLSGVRITGVPSAGSLTLSGSAVSAGDMITAADIAAGHLVFTPGADANGAGYASVVFAVRDQSGAEDGSAQTLTINVDGVNDAPTDITLSRADVDENSASGTSVGTLGAVDADVGDSFTYTLLDDAGGLFALNGDVLEVAGALNHEAAGSHDIVVEVDDGQATYQRTLTISVNDVNEAPSGADVTVTTAEDTPRTFLVSDFGFSDVDDGDSLSGVRITGVPSAGSLTLSGSAVSAGDMITAADIAAGHLVFTPGADANGAGYASVVFAVRDQSGAEDGSAQTLTINVDGVNDAPTDITLSRADVDENSASGTSVGTLGAVDADVGDSFTYTLLDDAGGLFALNGDVLEVAGALNHEAAGSHDIVVEVDDGQATYQRTLTISVNDVNEAPSGADVTVTTAEDTPRTFLVSDFGFSDVDDGDSLSGVRITGVPSAGSLTLSGSAVSAGDMITAADIAAGHLVFTPGADANGAGYASVVFAVRDQSGAEDGSAQTLTINVDGVNDAPTDITLSRADVDENSASGTSVGTLGAVDADVGDSFTYTLLDDAGGLFALNGDVLEVAGALNHEAAGSHDIVVEVDDGQATYQRTLTISVNDVNEAPSGADVTVTTAEDTPRTFLVSDFGFSDVDDGDSLSGVRITGVPSAGSLTLSGSAVSAGDMITAADIAAGHLVFTPGADANGAGYASVVFAVRDQSGAEDGSAQTLTINVDGVNDAPTDITLSRADVDENSASGTSVGTLGAVDADVGDSFTYTLLDDAGGLFALNGDVLEVAGALNHEAAGSHDIVVEVDDGQATYQRTLTISVNDVNEAPSGADVTVTTAEDTPRTFLVSDFGFSDVDDGDSLSGVRITGVPSAGSLTLSGSAVSAGDMITAADIAAGHLVFTPGADANGAGYASVVFAVRDQSGAEDGSAQTLTINVDGVNDAPTDITLSRADVDENSASGTSVGTLGAVDADVGDSFTYTLLDDAGGLFALNGDVLEVAGALNHEAAGSHDIVVEVDDGQATYQRTLTISVNDVNEAPSGADVTVTTAEDTPRTFLVSDFGFSDVDDGDSLSGVRITGVPSAGSLTLSGSAVSAGDMITAADIAAGHLVFTPGADANGAGYASVVFAVRDQSGAEDGSAQTLTINVDGVNDAPTDITLSRADVDENSASGTSVGTLGAVDADVGDSFTYTLLDDAGGLFALNGDVLEVAGALNHEAAGSHDIVVEVDDGQATYQRTLTISVNDVFEVLDQNMIQREMIESDNADGTRDTSRVDLDVSDTTETNQRSREIISDQVERMKTILQDSFAPTFIQNQFIDFQFVSVSYSESSGISQETPTEYELTNMREVESFYSDLEQVSGVNLELEDLVENDLSKSAALEPTKIGRQFADIEQYKQSKKDKLRAALTF